MLTVYLSGPMAKCSTSETGWRDRAIGKLPGFEFFDPRDIRAESLLPEELVDLDTSRLMTCDLVLFNIWKLTPGTLGELSLARFFKKELYVVVAEDLGIVHHPWIVANSKVFTSLDAAIAAIWSEHGRK